ncbi:DNA cytosine methyltransferase [Micrococcus luteus]
MAGLFAGIGGIEEGFRRALGDGVSTDLLCEWWDPAKRVLASRFPDVELHPDVRELKDLPESVDVLAAGFPCTDLSQAGRTAGITGKQSGLVVHVFEMLSRRAAKGRALPTLLIENVPNMLSLDKGAAMRFLVDELEKLGYRWAYRVVDTRSTGLPQRRRRVLLVASTTLDPKTVLFADEAQARPIADYSEDLFGFYWTEGRGGLGWAPDAVPTLKGGSTVGIASPPAIWVPGATPERSFVTPTEDDMEALQGFERGWTDVDLGLTPARHRGTRGKLLGNAVTTRVAEWVAGRIANPGEVVCPTTAWGNATTWPTAAAGGRGERVRMEASEFPILRPYEHLRTLVDVEAAPALSARAVAGFHSRLSKGNLGWHPGFREAVAESDTVLTTAAVLGKPVVMA